MERWMMRDPLEIMDRIMAQKKRREEKTREGRKSQARRELQQLFGDAADMTEDQSRKLEDYLMIWYEWERQYFPKVGAPSVSIYARQAVSAEVYDDDDQAEQRWRRSIAETIEAGIKGLKPLQRSAVDIHCCAKATGASVLRNPRMTIEQHHREYQEAKAALWAMRRIRDIL